MGHFRELINAEVWLGIPKDMALAAEKESLGKRVAEWVYRRIFRRNISHFSDSSDRGGE